MNAIGERCPRNAASFTVCASNCWQLRTAFHWSFVSPGSCADLQGLAELALDLPEMAELFVDAGYNFYEWEDYLQETENLRLQVPRKTNSKRGREPWVEIYKSLMRKYIETTIGEISKLFPKKIHATNLNGFLLKIALFLFAYQIDKAFIQ